MLSLDDLLTPPFATDTNWSSEEINTELENNCQGILSYVVVGGLRCRLFKVRILTMWRQWKTVQHYVNFSQHVVPTWLRHKYVDS